MSSLTLLECRVPRPLLQRSLSSTVTGTSGKETNDPGKRLGRRGVGLVVKRATMFAGACARLQLDSNWRIVRRLTKYATPAAMKTFEKPTDKAMMIGSMDPSTEAQPFVAHAQGIRSSLEPSSILTPRGKGTPIRMPRGATTKNAARSLRVVGSPRSWLTRGEARP